MRDGAGMNRKSAGLWLLLFAGLILLPHVLSFSQKEILVFLVITAAPLSSSTASLSTWALSAATAARLGHRYRLADQVQHLGQLRLRFFGQV